MGLFSRRKMRRNTDSGTTRGKRREIQIQEPQVKMNRKRTRFDCKLSLNLLGLAKIELGWSSSETNESETEERRDQEQVQIINEGQGQAPERSERLIKQQRGRPFDRLKKRKQQQRICLSNPIKRLRAEMEELGKEQQLIKEGQRRVREKFEAIESECDQPRKETNLIMQPSFRSPESIRLAFLFRILIARENGDFETAARLTAALRELIAREQDRRTKSVKRILKGGD